MVEYKNTGYYVTEEGSVIGVSITFVCNDYPR